MSLLKAIIFDLDGTLVESNLNFEQMRLDLGIAPKLPILEEIAKEKNRQKVNKMHEILEEHEMEGALRSKLLPYVKDFLAYLNTKRIKTAVLTRNSKRCTEISLEKNGLFFETVLTREDVKVPKPDPEGLLKIVNDFNLSSENAVYIGDFSFDIDAAKNANMKSIYFGKNPKLQSKADAHFDCYLELKENFSKIFNHSLGFTF